MNIMLNLSRKLLGIGALVLSFSNVTSEVEAQTMRIPQGNNIVHSIKSTDGGYKTFDFDLNQDGKPDLLRLESVSSSEYDYRLLYAENKGNGDLKEDVELVRIYEQRRAKDLNPTKAPMIRGQLLEWGLKDVTGDRKVDIFFSVRTDPQNVPCELYLMSGRKNGTFENPRMIDSYGASLRKGK